MSRTLLILLVFIALIGSFFVIRTVINSYKLPLDEQNQGDRSNLEKWRLFSNAEGKFKVSLPALPQHVSDKIPDPVTREQRKFDMFASADDNGVAYVVSIITLPGKVEANNVENALRSVVNDMLARNKTNKLRSANMGNFQGANALDFAFDNGEITVLGKAILHGSVIYILSVVGKSDVFNKESFDFFVNSFQIQDRITQ